LGAPKEEGLKGFLEENPQEGSKRARGKIEKNFVLRGDGKRLLGVQRGGTQGMGVVYL